MKIDELDEWQGLTSEMIQTWLLANGWQQVEQRAYQLDSPPVRTGWLFRKGDETIGTGATLNYVLSALSRVVNKTPQSLLREINPRMRKGMPSKAALAAHDHWLVRDTETGELELHRVENGYLYSMSVYHGGVRTPDAKALPDFGSWMEFWPCDECGNKVRWPTDAQGNML